MCKTCCRIRIGIKTMPIHNTGSDNEVHKTRTHWQWKNFNFVVPYHIYAIGRSPDPESHSVTKSSICFLFGCFSSPWFLSALHLVPTTGTLLQSNLESVFKHRKSPVPVLTGTGTVQKSRIRMAEGILSFFSFIRFFKFVLLLGWIFFWHSGEKMVCFYGVILKVLYYFLLFSLWCSQ